MSWLVMGEMLYMYLAIIDHAVSVVLVWVEQDIQKLIYYVNKTLMEVETHYLPLEKVALVVIHATWKLPYYF